MTELKILAACLQDRKAYESIKQHISKEFSPQGELVWKGISDFFAADNGARLVDRELLASRTERGIANPKHVEAIRQYIRTIPDGVSGINIVKEVLALKRSDIGSKLAAELLGRGEPKQELIDQYLELREQTELGDAEQAYKIHKGTSVSELSTHVDASVRVPLYPNSLNERIGGGCVPGDSVLIFARPECGKTAAALNFLRGLCKAGKTGIYFGNEDAIARILLRAKASFAELTTEECLNAPADADKRAEDNGFGNATFVEMYPGSVAQIREVVEAERPHAIIIDQLPNLEGAKSENYTLHLGTLARGVREIGKRYGCVTICFCQAGDSANGKLVLDMGDINWSNTDVQAQADLMIGMGMSKEYEAKDWRMWSLCKNKLTGIHDYFPVRIDRAKSRIYSL